MVDPIRQPESPGATGNSNDLRGSTAVVTGSSGGIGQAIAVSLARAGAAVLVHGHRRRDAAERTAQVVRDLSVPASVVLCDLASDRELELLAEQAWQWRGGVDIWVNNAGVDVLTGEAASWSFEKKLERLWQVDVRATIRLSRLVGNRMKQQGRGTIINVGWDQAEYGMGGDSGEMFSAIKGAVMAFTRGLAQSLAPTVRVNCVAPGWIKTTWGDQASEYWQQRACREALLGRWGTPEDVAGAVCFLCSPAASFITGHVLPVNGGFRHGP